MLPQFIRLYSAHWRPNFNPSGMAYNNKMGKKTQQKAEDQVFIPAECYEAESIVKMKVWWGRRFYLIKWKGYSEDDSTWEPIANLQFILPDLLQFEQAHKEEIRAQENEWNQQWTEKRVGEPLEEFNANKIRRQIKKMIGSLPKPQPQLEDQAVQEASQVSSSFKVKRRLKGKKLGRPRKIRKLSRSSKRTKKDVSEQIDNESQEIASLSEESRGGSEKVATVPKKESTVSKKSHSVDENLMKDNEESQSVPQSHKGSVKSNIELKPQTVLQKSEPVIKKWYRKRAHFRGGRMDDAKYPALSKNVSNFIASTMNKRRNQKEINQKKQEKESQPKLDVANEQLDSAPPKGQVCPSKPTREGQDERAESQKIYKPKLPDESMMKMIKQQIEKGDFDNDQQLEEVQSDHTEEEAVEESSSLSQPVKSPSSEPEVAVDHIEDGSKVSAQAVDPQQSDQNPEGQPYQSDQRLRKVKVPSSPILIDSSEPQNQPSPQPKPSYLQPELNLAPNRTKAPVITLSDDSNKESLSERASSHDSGTDKQMRTDLENSGSRGLDRLNVDKTKKIRKERTCNAKPSESQFLRGRNKFKITLKSIKGGSKENPTSGELDTLFGNILTAHELNRHTYECERVTQAFKINTMRMFSVVVRDEEGRWERYCSYRTMHEYFSRQLLCYLQEQGCINI